MIFVIFSKLNGAKSAFFQIIKQFSSHKTPFKVCAEQIQVPKCII